MSKIAVFGGAFDPVTLAHKQIIEELMKDFEGVIVVPSYAGHDKKYVCSFDDRIKMLRAISFQQQGEVEISSIERDLQHAHKGSIPTSLLLDALAENLGKKNIVFVVGEDNKGLGRFSNREYILQNYMIHCLPAISGIRSSIFRSSPSNKMHLLDESVKKYIEENGLFC